MGISYHDTIRYDTIRYNTAPYIYVRPKVGRVASLNCRTEPKTEKANEKILYRSKETVQIIGRVLRLAPATDS